MNEGDIALAVLPQANGQVKQFTGTAQHKVMATWFLMLLG